MLLFGQIEGFTVALDVSECFIIYKNEKNDQIGWRGSKKSKTSKKSSSSFSEITITISKRPTLQKERKNRITFLSPVFLFDSIFFVVLLYRFLVVVVFISDISLESFLQFPHPFTYFFPLVMKRFPQHLHQTMRRKSSSAIDEIYLHNRLFVKNN